MLIIRDCPRDGNARFWLKPKDLDVEHLDAVEHALAQSLRAEADADRRLMLRKLLDLDQHRCSLGRPVRVNRAGQPGQGYGRGRPGRGRRRAVLLHAGPTAGRT